jgi:hypothetical protein
LGSHKEEFVGKKSILIFSLSLILWSGALADADKPDSSGSGKHPEYKTTCFRGRPLSRCKTFWVLEFSYLQRLDTKPSGWVTQSGTWYLTGDIGHMVNISRKSALGATLFIGGDDDSGRMGIIPRFRYWFGPGSSGSQPIRLDFSAGPLLSITDNYLEPKTPGFMGNISLNFEDWFALTTQVEIIRFGPKQHFYDIKPVTDVGFYAGFKTCSYAAPICFVVLTVLAAVSIGSSF